jgi:hypothetical protein
MGFRAYSEKMIVEGILQNVPGFAPEELLADGHGLAQTHPQVCHPMPGFTECPIAGCHIRAASGLNSGQSDRKRNFGTRLKTKG